jgi:hypothetical protein
MKTVHNKSEQTLLNYLNGAGWTLDFASSTDQAIIYLDWDRFAVLHFVDAYWASVYAGFASVQVSLLTIILTNFPFSLDFSRCLEAVNIHFCKLYPVATLNSSNLTSQQFR